MSTCMEEMTGCLGRVQSFVSGEHSHRRQSTAEWRLTATLPPDSKCWLKVGFGRSKDGGHRQVRYQ